MKKIILIGGGLFAILSCVGIILGCNEDVEKRVVEDWKKKGLSNEDIDYLLHSLPEGKVKKTLIDHNKRTYRA